MPEKNFCKKGINNVINVPNFLTFLSLSTFPLYKSTVIGIFLFARVNVGNVSRFFLSLSTFPLYKSTFPGFFAEFLRFSETVEK